jgi:hypothetical protein
MYCYIKTRIKKDSLLVIYYTTEDNRNTIQKTTNNTIQAIENFITNSNSTEYINNV